MPPAPLAKTSRRSPSAASYGLGTTTNYLCGAASIGLVATAKYLRRTTSAAAGNCAAGFFGLGTTAKYLRHSTSGATGNGKRITINYLRRAANIGLGTTIKYLRRTTSAAAGRCLGTTIKYLLNQNAGAGNNWVRPTTPGLCTNSAESPCSVAAFVVKSEPQTGARPSVRLCVGPELAR
jgi:hypothetical protein